MTEHVILTKIFCSFLSSANHLLLIFHKVLFCFASGLIKREPLLHCVFVHLGGGKIKEMKCLFGLISNIISVSQKSLTAPLIYVKYLYVKICHHTHTTYFKAFNTDTAMVGCTVLVLSLPQPK